MTEQENQLVNKAKKPDDQLVQDQRIYRVLKVGGDKVTRITVTPYSTYGSWASEFGNTPGDILRDLADKLAELPTEGDMHDNASNIEKIREEYKNEAMIRIKHVQELQEKFKSSYIGVHSMIHPYALVKLYGATESTTVSKTTSINTRMVDDAKKRKWYEDATSGVSDGEIPMYAKNPTTAAVISWGNSDNRGRFPYSFQDFVFCKYWNKIQNNRMITLRRYPSPVNDSVEPNDYDDEGNDLNSIFNPVATAVTFFGGESGNKLSDILKFSVGYNWDEAKGQVWNVTAQQNEGSNLFSGTGTGVGKYLSGGIGALAFGLGVLGDLTGDKDSSINVKAARGLPPDPYSNGPYENRIIGPVNIINTVKKRKEGLKFSQEGLTIKFKYVARPIANVNTKAVLLDLLANMMVMTSSEGTFFGGIHRYREAKPAIYPWRGKDSLNKLYSGKLFGTDGAFGSMIHYAWDKGVSAFMSDFGKNFIGEIKQAAADLINGIKGAVSGVKSVFKKGDKEGGGETEEEGTKEEHPQSRIMGTLERAVSARMLKSMNIPWLQDAHALLTGEPVGDWHLTIGNPLNPIAVIGNLVMSDATFEFSDELGPDDFPLEMTVTVKLEHGMGRDRSGAESMFNRGHGRIYVLSDDFKSSADYETQVDSYTGSKNGNILIDGSGKGRIAGEDFNDLGTGVSLSSSGMTNAVIGSVTDRRLSNSGIESDFALSKYVANLNKIKMTNNHSLNDGYYIAPWTMRYTL